MSRLTPPDLQSLVMRYGTFDRIPPDAWREHDAAMADYQTRVRLGKRRDADQQSAMRRIGRR